MNRKKRNSSAKGFGNRKREVPLIADPWALGKPWSDGNADSYLHQRRRLSYREKRIWLNSQQYPRFLYKFKATDERCMPHLEDMVIHSKLYLSSPIQFNDPFDMAAEMETSGSLDDILRKIDDSAAVPYWDKQNKKDEARRIVEETGVQGYFDRHNSPLIFREFLERTGVFSFSSSKINERSSGPRNVLMWSHYGDSHSGVCLQFEIAHELALLRWLVNVQYEHDFPRVNWLSRRYKEEVSKAVLNKDLCWSYEHEWRLILYECANKYLSISPYALTSIVVGCKMSDVKLRAIQKMLYKREALGMPPVKLFKTVKSKHKYELRIERIR